MPSVLITAGFDKAPNAIALAELLLRNRVNVRGVLVVSPYSFKRLRKYVRQRGWRFVVQAVRRMAGTTMARGEDPMVQLFDRHDIRYRSLKTWAKVHGVPHHLVKSINSSEAIRIVCNAEADWVVYGGGGILHDAFIDAASGRILNAHHGPLPEIRGMNAVEWSLLLGYSPSVTVHVINRGIDTGGAITQFPVLVNPADCIDTLRSRATAISIEALVETVLTFSAASPVPHGDASRQCFILAPAVRELLEQRLSRGDTLRTSDKSTAWNSTP